MSKASISSEDQALLQGWVEFSDGVHATRAPQIIEQALQSIKQQRIFCVVVAKGYESGKVVLIEYGSGRMVLDLPVDWPKNMAPQPLRVLFKDKAQLWNQFAVKLLKVTEDSLITTMPLKYVRIQRRENYRVGVPPGSLSEFQHRGRLLDQFAVENISANGALFSSAERKLVPVVGETVTGVVMRFPVEGGKPAEVRIKEGRVVRNCDNEQREACCGVYFEVTPQEEKGLLHYVRLRERELLRRGMAD